ncbi:hypothetical protein THOD04_220035 [Vibrio owensii]|nr:hypothetical protein THOD04_220035 [Vibrio owensii]
MNKQAIDSSNLFFRIFPDRLRTIATQLRIFKPINLIKIKRNNYSLTIRLKRKSKNKPTNLHTESSIPN